MRKTAVFLAAAIAVAAPAYAQLGNLGKIKQRAEQAKKLADIKISDKDERAIGESVSQQLISRFGVYQDPAVTKYVTLVGTVMAQASERPNLDWRFIVLDTDGVNAYAAPGGLVHITRGALGLIRSEAELAGVLGHELTHITKKHTVNAIQKGKLVDAGTDEIGAQGGLAGSLVNRLADAAYSSIFENKFGRDDEIESDKIGVQLANKVGYSPNGLSVFLTRLGERNQGRREPNGLFASHPLLKERLDRIAKTIKDAKLAATATADARYASTIKLTAKPVAAIAMAPVPGAKGLTGDAPAESSKNAKAEEKKEEPKKKGFGLGGLSSSLTQGKQAESTQASASAGGRMAWPDTDAVGGTSRTPVRVTVTAADVEAFKKGIV